MTCSVPACDRQVQSRGMCHTHYERQRLGRPLGGAIDMSPEGRFFAKVEKADSGCWLWRGATDGDGRYGAFHYDGKLRRAHRVSYEWRFGKVTEGVDLDHLCRVTLCVNPDHLEPVTHRENILRGVGIAATNAAKTHCKRGHAFTPENTKILTNGGRYCLACHEIRKPRRAALQAARRARKLGAPFDAAVLAVDERRKAS